MAKLILSVSDLSVDSFETAAAPGQAPGTVHANQTGDPRCPTYGPTCEHVHTCGNTCLGGQNCDDKGAGK